MKMRIRNCKKYGSTTAYNPINVDFYFYKNSAVKSAFFVQLLTEQKTS